MGDFGIGQPVPREEDPYLVRGAGRYVDDVKPRQSGARLCAALAACPCAHRFDRRDAREGGARRALVLTGEDEAVLALGLHGRIMPRKRRDGSPVFISPQPPLARGRVRYIGDPVALVVADTLDQAKDAAELIEVDYEDLPAVTTSRRRSRPARPRYGTVAPTTSPSCMKSATKPRPRKPSPRPPMSSAIACVINRITTISMEPRGCLAEYDPREDRTTVRVTVQGPHCDPAHPRARTSSRCRRRSSASSPTMSAAASA